MTGRILLALLCLLALVTSCARPTQMGYHWTRANTDQTQWAQDDYACKRENERPYSRTVASPMAQNPLAAFGMGLQGKDPNAPVGVESGVEVNEQMYVACMQARGYSYTIEKVPDSIDPRGAKGK
jgi:hypothetical protein